MKKLGTISPYYFEGYFLFALDSAWKNVLGKIVTFDVSIDSQKRLHIRSN
ncbi:hypothetical protein [Nitrosopumilus sp.]